MREKNNDKEQTFKIFAVQFLWSCVHLQTWSLPISCLYFLKTKLRLRQIPVGDLFRRTVGHFDNGWQNESRPLVPTHTSQEVRDPTETFIHHWDLIERDTLFRIWAVGSRGERQFVILLFNFTKFTMKHIRIMALLSILPSCKWLSQTFAQWCPLRCHDIPLATHF